MGFRAADYSVTIVALEKNGKKYGMSCAWMMQVDYDKILCLIGSQSATGDVICKGDKVGVSTLSKNQKEIANYFGSVSSKDVDKFEGRDYVKIDDGAICILDASRMMFCEVIDVIRLEGIEEDRLVYFKIEEAISNNDDFLHYGDM